MFSPDQARLLRRPSSCYDPVHTVTSFVRANSRLMQYLISPSRLLVGKQTTENILAIFTASCSNLCVSILGAMTSSLSVYKNDALCELI